MRDPDLPISSADTMSEAERCPLAAYAGAAPPAPRWFSRAIAHASERSRFAVAGRAIELLCWGTLGKPGLLFLHGMGANADWWSFIAPWFADEYRCAAISFSGMGGSDWAETYSLEGFADEAIAAIDAAGLAGADAGPILVAHSLGGNPAMIAAARDPRIARIICIDTAITPRYAQPAPRAPHEGRHRVYAQVSEALARFRLDPPQTAANHFALDHIARAGLVAVDDAAGTGFRWRFDPKLWNRLDRSAIPSLPTHVRCPMTYLHGGRSQLIDDEILAFMRGVLPAGTPILAVPDADHHVLIDQPLALVAMLRGLLAERRTNGLNA